MVDLDSGEVIEFVDEEIERLQHAIAEKHGYEIVPQYGVVRSRAQEIGAAARSAGFLRFGALIQHFSRVLARAFGYFDAAQHPRDFFGALVVTERRDPRAGCFCRH